MAKLNIRGMIDERQETKRLFCSLVMVIMCIFSSFVPLPSSLVYATVPHLINYQGRLTDTSGSPLNGSYALTFRIYDAETAGNLLWEENQTGVLVQKGIFNIMLGSVTNLNLTFDKPYFLEIKVGGEVMTPRQRMTSAGYAIKAEKTETADQAQNANTVANVGVSTTPVANKILPLDANAKIPLTALGLKVFDSGWFLIEGPNKTYTKSHNLGTTKAIALVYSANDSSGTNMFPQQYLDGNGASPTGMNISNITITTVTLRTYIAWYNNGQLDNGSGWTQSGYARIIMLALE